MTNCEKVACSAGGSRLIAGRPAPAAAAALAPAALLMKEGTRLVERMAGSAWRAAAEAAALAGVGVVEAEGAAAGVEAGAGARAGAGTVASEGADEPLVGAG